MNKENPLAPTPSRIKKAKDQGEDSQSQEVYQFASLLSFTIGSVVMGFYLYPKISLFSIGLTETTDTDAALKAMMYIMLEIAGLVCLFALLGSITGYILNRRRLPTFYPMKFRFNPVQQYFSKFNAFTMKDTARTMFLFLIVISATFGIFFFLLPSMMSHILWGSSGTFGAYLNYIGLWTGLLYIIFAIFAVFDRISTGNEFLGNIRMNHSDLNRELKDNSGNPEIKSKRKELNQEEDG